MGQVTMKVHWPHMMRTGTTLCGIKLNDLSAYIGVVYMRSTCKRCQKMHRARIRKDKK